jgi:hypothetical protein
MSAIFLSERVNLFDGPHVLTAGGKTAFQDRSGSTISGQDDIKCHPEKYGFE